MRVLYLSPFSQQVSGPDESLLTLLQALLPLGVEAHLILPKTGPQVERYTDMGVSVHYAPLSILKRRMGIDRIVLYGPSLACGAAAVARIARREKVDLIHTNMEVVADGAIASLLLGLPHILHYRGNTLDRPKPVFDVLTRFWAATSANICCISDATADIFRKRGLGRKVHVLYNPVNVAAFAEAERSDAVRRELGAGPDDFLIGNIGRIHPRKDIATFLRAGAILARDLANVRLVVVGLAEAPEELAYESEMRRLAHELCIYDRTCWAGARREMPAVQKALDLLVLSSRHEGFGRVAAEAIAAGTPLVASREGALPELARGEVARLADPGSPDDFARQIRLSLRDLLRPPRAPARATPPAFDSTIIAERIIALYRDTLAAL